MRALLVVLATAWGGVTEAGFVIIDYRAATAAPLPCERGSIVAESSAPKTVRVGWTRGSAPVALELENGVTWRIGLDAERCWAQDIVIAAGETAAQRSAPIWPAATVRARLSAGRGVRLPPAASIVIDDGETRPSGACAIEAGQLNCRAPAMTGDVRVDVPGFAPVYAWNRTVAPHSVTSLGDITLNQAASLSGRVTTGRTGESVAGSVVTIKPSHFAQTREEQRRIDALTRTAKATATGLFQFSDLEPGRYEIRAAKDGLSPTEVMIVNVEGEREATLPRDLLLEPLVDFEVAVTPAVGPDGQPWIVRVKESTYEQPKTIESPAGVDGRWSNAGLEAGMYVVTVLDRTRSVFFERGVQVTAAQPLLAVTVDGVVVRGRVTLGDEPLPGWVKFRRQYGGKRASFPIGEDGAFSGVLPAEGSWEAEVIPENETYALRKRPIDIRRGGGGFAEVEIELEEGRVKGQVVDESGKSSTALVHVLDGYNRVTHDRTADDGTFEFVGVPVGELRFRAARSGSDSGIVTHRVTDDAANEITLVLRRLRSARARLVNSAGRAISGATVRYFGSAGEMQECVSGPDGELELAAAVSDATLDVVIVAPPFPIKLIRLPIDGETRELVLDRTAGTLLIKASVNGRIYLRHGAVTAALFSMLSPSPRHARAPEWTPRGWAFALEPGEYLVCRSYFAPPGECQSARIVAGGEQIVKVDTSDELSEVVR